MNDTYLTRETLLKRMKSLSSDEAWEEFVSLYKGYIYSIIRKMQVFENDVDDLYQTVMMRLWKSLPKFNYEQRQGRFHNWLYTVVRNSVFAHFNSNIRYSDHKQKFRDESLSQDSNSELEKIFEEEWQKHIAAMAFKNIKAQVSEKAIDVFLASLKNEAVSETAERLSITENSVYVYRMRVKNALTVEIDNLREYLE